MSTSTRRWWILTALLAIGAAVASGFAVYFVNSDSTSSSASPSSPAATPSGPGTTPTQPSRQVKGLPALIPLPLFKNSCVVSSNPLISSAMQSAVCTPPANPADRTHRFYPDRWEVSIFPNATALHSAYAALRRQSGTGTDFGKCNSVTWGGEGAWTHGPGMGMGMGMGNAEGRFFCYFAGNVAVIAWTNEKVGQAGHVDMLAVARVGGSDHPALFRWWRFWHHQVGTCPEAGCA